MKKKIMPKVLIIGILTCMLSSQVYAEWYSSPITLPRNGWWYTVARTATSNTQRTRVSNPKYDVVSNITKSNKELLSTNKTHNSGKTDIQSHYTGLNGASLRASFRSSIINQHTNKVNLAWEP